MMSLSHSELTAGGHGNDMTWNIFRIDGSLRGDVTLHKGQAMKSLDSLIVAFAQTVECPVKPGPCNIMWRDVAVMATITQS